MKNIDGLEGLTNLVTLELHHNILEKLDGIEQLQQLEQLKVEYNKLTDDEIGPLTETLQKLSLLTAKGNEVKDELLKRLDKLNKIWIEKNMRGQGTGSSSTGAVE